MKANVRRLWNLLGHYSGFQDTSNDAEIRRPLQRRSRQGHRSGLISLLSFIPWLLTSVFLLSFFWDFDGFTISIFGSLYALEGLLRIVSVSGLIGFLTNWLAITMLFRPSDPRPLLGHGLIPAQKNLVAERMAAAVSDDLINPDIIMKRIRKSGAIRRYRKDATGYLKSIIDKPGFREDLKAWFLNFVREMADEPEIRDKVTNRVIKEAEEAFPEKSFENIALRAYTLFKGDNLEKIISDALKRLPDSIESELDKLDDFLDQLPGYLENESEGIESAVTILVHQLVYRLNVYSLVEENIKKYDEGRLESLIRGATNEQLLYIQYLGAMLGTIGGFVIWQPVLSLTVLILCAAVILALDSLLQNRIKKK